MKKTLMILLSIFLLASCGDVEDTIIKSTIDEEENLESESHSEQLADENMEASSEEESNHQNDAQREGNAETNDAKNNHLKDFPEYMMISNHIDLSTYTGTIQSDNKGNRIILFANTNGQNEYKSIYVKHDNRLKIVTFDDDALLFNDIIQ